MLPHTMNGKWHQVVLALLGCCLLSVVSLRCEAQNLVPNPSFELQDTCPYLTGFLGNSKPLYWERWNQTPEYFDGCVVDSGSDTLLDVPQNGAGFQHAVNGDAYVGMFAYAINEYREYVGCHLLQPLEVGQAYEMDFYTNVAFGGSYWAPIWASNNMGMLFTMTPNVWTDVDQPDFALRNYAHLTSTAIINDTANWTLLSGTFVADSAYQYMVLGNFFSNSLTDSIHLLPGPSLGAYYFVDDVCVRQLGQGCTSTNGTPDGVSGDLIAWPNPTSGYLHVSIEPGMHGRVFDATGRLLEAIEGGNGTVVIPTHSWSSGVYVLQLQGNPRKSLRFFVMH